MLEDLVKKRNAASAKKGVLTEAQVLRVKLLLEGGEHPKVIAGMLGVSVQTIVRIRDGVTWGWLRTMGDVVVPRGISGGVGEDKLQEHARKMFEMQQAGRLEEIGKGEKMPMLVSGQELSAEMREKVLALGGKVERESVDPGELG